MNNIEIANAVGKAMVPYFGRIMEHLKIYLSGQLTEEEMPLQIQALGQYSTIFLIIYHSHLTIWKSLQIFRYAGRNCSNDW